MLPRVYPDYLAQWASEAPEAIWLRDRQGDEITAWSWARAQAEIDAVAGTSKVGSPPSTSLSHEIASSSSGKTSAFAAITRAMRSPGGFPGFRTPTAVPNSRHSAPAGR